MIQEIQPKVQAAIGAGLMSTPLWVNVLQTASLIASTIAAICGAIVGIHAVIRICRGKKKGE